MENNHFYIDPNGILRFDLFDDDNDASSIQGRTIPFSETDTDLTSILKQINWILNYY